jgi:nifR3 family TIM-barrel protein
MNNPVAAPLAIGSLVIPNRAVLAPLAGVTDVPFRRICQEHGAGLTYVEMLSATAICYNNKRTFEMMTRHSSEKILGAQVTGPTPEEVGKAIAVLNAEGFETIDINMGCPVRKVVSAGCGSGFLLDPSRISATLHAARAETAKPLSAKFRLGWSRESVTVDDTVGRAVEAHVDMCTIHGRTRSESYDTKVDLPGIARGVKTLKTLSPTTVALGNGDVFSFDAACTMMRETGCDGVMISRGAMGNPWIFAEIALGNSVVPTLQDWLETVERHMELQAEHYGNNLLAARLMRKNLLWYARGFPKTRALRATLGTVESLQDARTILHEWASTLPKTLPRYAKEHDLDETNSSDLNIVQGE